MGVSLRELHIGIPSLGLVGVSLREVVAHFDGHILGPVPVSLRDLNIGRAYVYLRARFDPRAQLFRGLFFGCVSWIDAVLL